jgi:hypothetical protein
MAETADYVYTDRALVAPTGDTRDTCDTSATRRDTTPRQTAPERPVSPPVSRDTTPRHVRQARTVSDTWHDDSTFVLVCRELSPGWTSKELAALLRKDQRTAQRRIAQWIESEWVTEIEEGRYQVTITEAQHG